MEPGLQTFLVISTCRPLQNIWDYGIDCSTYILWSANKMRSFGVGKASGLYFSRSAYKAFFFGSTIFACKDALWTSWAPLKCKIFLWLAIRRRCWTADRLQRHGLQNQGVCVFCLHSPETIDHLSVGCAVTAQIWGQFFSRLGLSRFIPVSQGSIADF